MARQALLATLFAAAVALAALGGCRGFVFSAGLARRSGASLEAGADWGRSSSPSLRGVAAGGPHAAGPGAMALGAPLLLLAAAGASRLASALLPGRGEARGAARGRAARRAAALMPWKIPNTSRWQWLSVQELLFRERIIMINQYIDEEYANANLAMLLYLQSEDAQKPISIYLAVPGAQLKPTLAIYDTISQMKAKGCKITTVSYSLVGGIGTLLAACGTKGRRFATPHSLFLLQKTGLESSIQGQAADIEVETRQMLRESRRVEEELEIHTGKKMEDIQKDLKRNFYLSAEAAVEYGLIDRVLSPNEEKGKRLEQGVRDPWSGQVTKEKVGFGVFADPNQPRTATGEKKK